jgi:hypothetical protein
MRLRKEGRKGRKKKKEKEVNGNRHSGGTSTSECCQVRLLRFVSPVMILSFIIPHNCQWGSRIE